MYGIGSELDLSYDNNLKLNLCQINMTGAIMLLENSLS